MTNLNLTQEIPTRSQTANAPLVIRAMTDQTAFVELYQIWVRPVYRFLYSKVSDHEIACSLTRRQMGIFSAYVPCSPHAILLSNDLPEGRSSCTLEQVV